MARKSFNGCYVGWRSGPNDLVKVVSKDSFQVSSPVARTLLCGYSWVFVGVFEERVAEFFKKKSPPNDRDTPSTQNPQKPENPQNQKKIAAAMTFALESRPCGRNHWATSRLPAGIETDGYSVRPRAPRANILKPSVSLKVREIQLSFGRDCQQSDPVGLLI